VASITRLRPIHNYISAFYARNFTQLLSYTESNPSLWLSSNSTPIFIAAQHASELWIS